MATKSNIAGKGKSSKAESSSSGKVAATGVSIFKEERAKLQASRLATVREGMFLHSVRSFSSEYFFSHMPAGIDHKRAPPISKPVEPEETNPLLDMPSTDSMKAVMLNSAT